MVEKQIEKQAIEEIASVLEQAKIDALATIGSMNEGFGMWYAKAIYNADYRKHIVGEWIEHDDDWCGTFYTCSACGCDWTTIDGTPQENNMRFCPKCGAHMKGGAE